MDDLHRSKTKLEPVGRGGSPIAESLAPIPILTARLYDREMFGLEALGDLAEDVFEEREPLDIFFRGATHDIVKNGEATTSCSGCRWRRSEV